MQKEQANWLKITLEGNKPNLNAVGAAVTVWAGELKQKEMVRTGSSYLSQSDLSTLIFGLGAHSKTDSLEILWPTSGKVTRLGPAKSGQTYLIKESNPILAKF